MGAQKAQYAGSGKSYGRAELDIWWYSSRRIFLEVKEKFVAAESLKGGQMELEKELELELLVQCRNAVRIAAQRRRIVGLVDAAPVT